MIDIVIILTATAAFIALGFVGTRISHTPSMLTRLPAFRIAAGLAMTFVGGAATITMAGLGHSNGWYGLVDPVAVVVGGLISAAMLTRQPAMDATQGIAEYFARGSTPLRVIYMVASLFVYTLMASAQVIAIAKLTTPYFGNSFATLFSVLCFLLIVLYVHLGGIAAVTRTDVAQFVIVVLLFVSPALIGLALGRGSGSTTNAVSQPPLDVRTILYLSLSFMFVPLSQDVWVRTKQATSLRDARIGVLAGVLIYALIVTIAIAVGVSAASTPLDDPETVLPAFFKKQLGIAGVVPTLFVLAAVLSTLDSFAFNVLTSLRHDLLPLLPLKSHSRFLWAAPVLLVVSCLSITVFAQSVLRLVLTALMIYVCVIGPGLNGTRINATRLTAD